MSELIVTLKRNEEFRRNLLANVSVFALLGIASLPANSFAAESGRPTVWIELGGQLERVDAPQSIFAPPFFGLADAGVLAPLVDAQRPSRYSTGAEGKVVLMPQGTDWVFSAALRYGRVKNSRHAHYQTPGQPTFFNTFSNGARRQPKKPTLLEFGDGQTQTSESHLVVDFRAGKDVGLGLFGSDSSSVLAAGIRYAQFTSGSDATLHARPFAGYNVARYAFFPGKYQTVHKPNWGLYTASVHTARSTHAVGPSVSWDASLPVAGNNEEMAIAVDWGVNAAALFGRQRVREAHQTSGYHISYNNVGVKHTNSYVHHMPAQTRSRSVVIPNVGGFAGVSLKFPNAKVSLGYRGDFFFNAMDVGIDARDTARQNFYGPFATISIGLP